MHVRPTPEDSKTLTRRGVVALGLALAANAARAAPAPCASRVLFVCPAGTVKSAIAREMMKQSAARAGLKISIQSRGVHPEDHVSPALAGQLRRDGLNPAAEPVRALAASDIRDADIVIAFDEASEAPGMAGARNWAIPGFLADYAGAKAALGAKVEALVKELRSGPCGR